jgi:hypothetical protein
LPRALARGWDWQYSLGVLTPQPGGLKPDPSRACFWLHDLKVVAISWVWLWLACECCGRVPLPRYVPRSGVDVIIHPSLWRDLRCLALGGIFNLMPRDDNTPRE